MRKIFETSKTNNERRAITGVLCYKQGYFLQLLEGEELAVLRLYLKIAQDPRNTGCTVIHVSAAARRRFQNWTMGVMEQGARKPIDQEVWLQLRRRSDSGAEAVKMMHNLLRLMGDEAGARGPRSSPSDQPAPYQSVRYDREFFRNMRPPE